MKPIDTADQTILLALQRDARQTVAELVAPSPCWRRVRQLEEAGVIQGYFSLKEVKPAGSLPVEG